MGIHNESGSGRVSPIPTLSTLIPQLLELLMSSTDNERSFVPFQGGNKDHVVLLVNNLGGLSELELSSVVFATRRSLEERAVTVCRVLAGTFMVFPVPNGTVKVC